MVTGVVGRGLAASDTLRRSVAATSAGTLYREPRPETE